MNLSNFLFIFFVGQLYRFSPSSLQGWKFVSLGNFLFLIADLAFDCVLGLKSPTEIDYCWSVSSSP